MLVAEIARTTGPAGRFTRIPMADYVTALEEAQLPHDVIGLLRCLFTEMLDGRNASVRDGVLRTLGRRPREFGDQARATVVTDVRTPAVEQRNGNGRKL
ncbi:hypothetical protein [Paraburkholderia diazotrophica]|uniref:Uncharacterized protein n=1 Tax=Paraburkholderia diazotrophica TaxID=667676 RepID=A0A1H6WSH9_9BURK|nr:hypothetical protein [Paraburkholderia diazotrophica]SEJ18184.1 hypothetical protein SAMN05192539_1007180 [Paraburkholderia diazotrophica]